MDEKQALEASKHLLATRKDLLSTVSHIDQKLAFLSREFGLRIDIKKGTVENCRKS